jgi:hypothetical protein
LIKFDFARTFKGNTQAKAERNTKETMRDQKLSSLQVDISQIWAFLDFAESEDILQKVKTFCRK